MKITKNLINKIINYFKLVITMKENSESSDNNNIVNDDKNKHLINNSNKKKNDSLIYKQILNSKDFITIILNNTQIKIRADISLKRIIELSEIIPEKFVLFELNKKESLSLSGIFKKNNQFNIDNNEDEFKENKDINKKPLNNNIKLNKVEIFFYYYMKLLYFFYLFAGIIIFVHLMSLILKSKCHITSFYLWFSFLLVITLLYLGYIGVSYFNGVEINENNHEGKYNHDNIFWFNFGVLVLTMISFIFLIKEHYLDIKEEKYIGKIIFSFYIIIILLEIIALLFFDLTNRIFEKKISDGYTLLEVDEEKERLINI